MLPLCLDISALVYSEENAQKAGISVEGAENLQELAAAADLLYEQGLGDLYYFPYVRIRNWLMLDYINIHLKYDRISFHTEEFERILDLLLELGACEGIVDGGDSGIAFDRYQYISDYIQTEMGYSTENGNMALIAMENAYYEDVILKWREHRGEYEGFKGRNSFSVMPILSGDSGKGVFPAVADILVVNPSSSHLKEALQLVGKMAEATVQKPENYLSVDRTIYPLDKFSGQLYECYTKAEIFQTPPEELYSLYYWNYFDGKISREEFLDTIEYVINTYYFE